MEKDALPARPWLTIREASEVLKLHRDTVERLIDRGELPAKRFGRSWRIPRHAVEPKRKGSFTPPQFETK